MHSPLWVLDTDNLSLHHRGHPQVCRRLLAFGYRIVIFSDCAELDYVDHIVAPDGRRGDYNSWFEQDKQPLRLLNKLERCALEMKLEDAR